MEPINRLILRRRLNPLVIVAIHLIAGGLWITFSDLILNNLNLDPITHIRLEVLTDWIYILVTAVLLLILISSGLSVTEGIMDRQQVAESLRYILAVLNSDRPLQEILDTIVFQASKVLGADAAAIYRLQGKEDMLTIQSSQGLEDDYISLADIPIGQAATGRAAQQHEPVMISDVKAARSRVNLALDLQREALLEHLATRHRALLAVPLIAQGGELYGTLTLYYKEPQQFTSDVVKLATTFSDQAALAIENTHLRARAEQSAVAAERNRIARELHDSVTQALYSLTLYTDATRMALSSGKREKATNYLGELRNMAREAMLDMRLLIFELHPPILEKEGLAGALQTRLESVESRSGVQTEFRADGEGKLPLALERELYRIAQEALTNVVKHAKAQEVTVGLQFNPGKFCLEIWDNGIGFDPEEVTQSGGMGLRGIQERVQRIGGQLTLESVPNQGTLLRVEVAI